MIFTKSLLVLQYILCEGLVRAQSSTVSATACASTISPKNAAPSVAAGWQANVVANNLQSPRGMRFDGEGGLLIVQQEKGIVRVRFNSEAGDCVKQEGATEVVIDNPALNHGIELSDHGKTLYASSPDGVFAWDYDASTGRNTSGPRTIVGQTGGDNGHVTRTLLLSKKTPGMLLVSRGSQSNLDVAALDRSTGVSTIKGFNLTSSNSTNEPASSYNFAQDGLLLGWGLRNSVGVGEEPVTGGIYSVENSVDNFMRDGQNIHQNNPGEEMNFHGYLNGTQFADQGRNYGYPTCFAAWNVNEIPDNNGFQVGTQFAIGDQNATVNDTYCKEGTVAPRLTFAAHMAPLDIKFNPNGTAAWVSFHGSWNRDQPIGYKLSVIAFDGAGSPIAPSTSNTSYIDIVSNPDLSKCPDACFRPVGLAWDSQGRLYFSSDATGEIYVVTRQDGQSTSSANATTNGANSGAKGGNGKSVAAQVDVGVSAKVFAAAWAGIMALPLL
ncbi:soluble quino protein glucose dehydrogenase [Massarina eburnea CBS 473.64]|uniref:Soluble quino protein glucose dehydrogenase n=1 Tax=Massarina eburnea CBS 473.64 TaxID=1395130 RepID=A0A6A6RRP6_9PLEO|nr:soluble quino protein glucose dehydrogenase [Massarina eburnea CBS 473.64]